MSSLLKLDNLDSHVFNFIILLLNSIFLISTLKTLYSSYFFQYFRCKWYVNHPQDNLVKFGYRLNNKIEKIKYLVIANMLSFDVT